MMAVEGSRTSWCSGPGGQPVGLPFSPSTRMPRMQRGSDLSADLTGREFATAAPPEFPAIVVQVTAIAGELLAYVYRYHSLPLVSVLGTYILSKIRARSSCSLVVVPFLTSITRRLS